MRLHAFRSTHLTKASVWLLLCLPALSPAGCGARSASGEQRGLATGAAEAGPLAVKLVEATVQPWPKTIRVQGTLSAHEEAVIGAKVAGRVDKVHVDRGSTVAEGQALVELEMQDFNLRVQYAEAQLESARSKLGLRNGEADEKLNPLKSPPVMQELATREEAQIELDRIKQLARTSAATQEQVQKQEALFKVAKARYDSAVNNIYEQLAVLALRRVELAQAKQQRVDARITAPFPGIVHERHVSPGTYVRAGEPVAMVVRIDPLRFRAAVPERDVRLVQIGEPLLIHVEGQPEPIRSQVQRISPGLEKQSLSLLIEADVPNAGHKLRAGHFAEADITVDRTATALAVPESAVFEFAGVEKVWLVKEGWAREQRVQTGQRAHDRVQILGGLNTGERVIANAAKGRAGAVAEETATGNR